MLKPDYMKFGAVREIQPPSGGCVLKRMPAEINPFSLPQPPSGGCVLKLVLSCKRWCFGRQPPSGGCVLKP